MSSNATDPKPRNRGRAKVKEDADTLRDFLENLKSWSPELIFGVEPDEHLFHYTDLGGMHGIVNNHDLWLTNSRYCNDDEEMAHGYRVAKDVVAELLTAPESEDHKAYLERVAELLKNPPAEGVYICCFCKKDNLLSQWRSYSANGTGVSVEFDPQGFSLVTGPDSPPGGLMRLWMVFYEPARQRRILNKVVDYGFQFQNHLSVQERARHTADAIEFFIPTFKNEDFQDEDECRLIFTPTVDCPVKPQFRVARGMLVPYYSLKALSSGSDNPNWRLPIRGVRVGPSAQKWLNLESARMVLNQAGYADANFGVSDTPYRG